ncbi:hypothetical protein NECAME_04111 [Necator americanus]|uniref:ZP domain-containing protein n=1 Tax=Necator americanus TaxID=51031 RepID=W2SZ62_NECAM|nr:hypothetical protein NECAME_04111 [Necator americanus]ETN74246.1 hypothetical protein NECAME_04111 [Necator americanus]
MPAFSSPLSSLIVLLSYTYAVQTHLTVEIDNGVIGEPEVQCGSDSISLLFNSRNPFTGKVFVKGFVSDSDCVMMGDNKNTHRFTVKHNSCGVRRQREIFITKVDRAYRLSCFYVEGTKKVQQQLDVA